MCLYQFDDGTQCQLEDAGKGLCFWHDPTISKKDMPLADELSALMKAGHNMQGAALAFANLDGLDLVSHDKSIQYSLSKADFYHASLRQAHLFRVDFSQASLMKANCAESNFHFANLDQTNLLGTRLDEAKIEHVNWGENLYQETLASAALKSKQPQAAQAFNEQSEEVFRHLRKVSEHQGLFELAGHFFIKEMTMRRYQLPKYSLHRLTSKVVDVFCGYGEKPLRVVGFSITIIFLFSLIYWFMGIQDSQHSIQFYYGHSFSKNLIELLNCMYFSVVTFTTLGYGDLVPIGLSRFFAALEAFIGSFTIALFVVVFVKKMTR